jgi:RimJ/RimL family protein N-acetyltransferase
MKRGCIREAMHYVFKDLKCTRLTARTKKHNAPVRKMLIKLGFVYEGTMQNYYGAGDSALFYRLDPSSAERWLS